jgi:hypothetical protein
MVAARHVYDLWLGPAFRDLWLVHAQRRPHLRRTRYRAHPNWERSRVATRPSVRRRSAGRPSPRAARPLGQRLWVGETAAAAAAAAPLRAKPPFHVKRRPGRRHMDSPMSRRPRVHRYPAPESVPSAPIGCRLQRPLRLTDGYVRFNGTGRGVDTCPTDRRAFRTHDARSAYGAPATGRYRRPACGHLNRSGQRMNEPAGTQVEIRGCGDGRVSAEPAPIRAAQHGSPTGCAHPWPPSNRTTRQCVRERSRRQPLVTQVRLSHTREP